MLETIWDNLSMVGFIIGVFLWENISQIGLFAGLFVAGLVILAIFSPISFASFLWARLKGTYVELDRDRKGATFDAGRQS